MALDKTLLKNTIAAIMNDMLTRDEVSVDEFAERLSNAIDAYVKSATIHYSDGLAANSYPVYGSFNGSLT